MLKSSRQKQVDKLNEHFGRDFHQEAFSKSVADQSGSDSQQQKI